MKTKIKTLIFIITLIIFIILFLIFNYKTKDNNLNNIIKNKTKSIIIDNSINSWNFNNIITEIEKKWTWSLEREEKMKLVYSYLAYWNYFYKEEENSKKAMDILNTMNDDYDVLYNKWYSQEIIKNYTGALDYYNKWLEITNLSNENKSLLKNQIWHLYDLKWEFDKIFAYYDEAYKLDKENENVLWNLGRYYTRNWDIQKAYEFMNKALDKSTNLPSKAEISFSLSSLELELNWLTPDIDKSIDYARQSIDYYSNYPMWYVALARWLYMKNDSNYNQEIEENLDKSIELNPNWSYAYELYSLHKIDQNDYTGALDYIKMSANAVQKDMILMDSEREKTINSMWFDSIMIWTLRNWYDNQDLLLKLIDRTWKLENKKIVFQLKRNNYWIFQPLIGNETFKKLIENYTK